MTTEIATIETDTDIEAALEIATTMTGRDITMTEIDIKIVMTIEIVTTDLEITINN